MNVDELVLLLKSHFQSNLDLLKEKILRYSWEGRSYQSIALETQYEQEEIKKAASDVWLILSNIRKQVIDKSNFRSSFEDLSLSEFESDLIKLIASIANEDVALEFPNGPVPIDSKFYISRPPIEELAYSEIEQPGSFICVKAPRKMGKTSLNLRILNHAENIGYKTVNLDFQQAEKAVFTSINRFLRWFCANISRELYLEAQLDDYWDEEMGSKISCSLYFEAYLLSSLKTPIVIVLNEVDSIFEHSEIASDFLPLLRSWYEQAKRVAIWQKLRLVLTYSTEIIVPLKLSQSPFNVGLPLKLSNFSREQVKKLALVHNLVWMDDENVNQLMAMVGGQPYLVRLALFHLAYNKDEVKSLNLLLEQAPTEAGIYNSHLRTYLSILQEDVQLKSIFCKLVAANSPMKIDPLITYKLQSLGLIYLDGDNASIACELYRLYFQRQLCSSNDFPTQKLNELQNDPKKLRSDSNLDGLTKLFNRPYFESYLEQLVDWEGELSLILCNVDYFRYYNKTYGVAAGDICLQKIAGTIRNYVDLLNIANQEPLVARYGGEEFAVLVPVNEKIAFNIAENIREKIQSQAISCQYPGIGGLPAEVITVSVGVATILREDNLKAISLVDIAQKALRQAKRKGRNVVVAARN